MKTLDNALFLILTALLLAGCANDARHLESVDTAAINSYFAAAIDGGFKPDELFRFLGDPANQDATGRPTETALNDAAAGLFLSDARRLARQASEEIWQYAVRAYPNGIPTGARLKALEQMRATERRAGFRSGLASPVADASAIEGTSWFPLGPAPIDGFFAGGVSGRATAIAVNPFDPDDVWLGSAAGGVWHSTDGGLSWRPRSDNEASLAIGALALDNCTAVECVTIYAGTGENNLRRDTYYGAGLLIFDNVGEFPAWRLSGNALFEKGSINNVVLDPTTSDPDKRLYVTLSSGVTASATESTITAPEPPGGYGIFKSEDKGLTWDKLTVPGAEGDRPTDLEMDPQDNSTVFAGFLGRGIFKSADGGANWCPLNPGIAIPGCTAAAGLPDPTLTPFDHVELAIHRPAPAEPAILYAIFGNCTNPIRTSCRPSLYKSVDGGSTWTLQTDSAPESYSRYTHTLSIHPDDPSTIFFGGLRIHKSTNSGGTFTLSHSLTPTAEPGIRNVHLDHQALVIHPLDPNRMYDASDGGFAYSTDGGASWTPGNDDLQITGFQSLASSPLISAVIIGGAQDNGISMWTGTRRWNHAMDSDGGATIMDLADSLIMYATTQDVAPYRSTNGGGDGSWSFIGGGLTFSDPHAFYPPFIQDPSPPHPLYLGTNRLYRRLIGGGDWTRVSPILGCTDFDCDDDPEFPDILTKDVITAIAVAPNDPNRIYVGYYDGQVWVTTAGGPCEDPSCWTPIGGPANGLPSTVVTWLAVHPTDPDMAYATFSGFEIGAHVYKTTNGGATWSPASGAGAEALPDIPANTIGIEPGLPDRLWLGTDIGVFKSLDGGDTWLPFNRGLPNVPVYKISIDETHGRVYAGTHGRGAYVLTEPFVSNFEGWVDGHIWDIPVYGHGFLPNMTCIAQIMQQDGTACATGATDAIDGLIGTDDSGQLVTSRGGFYEGKPVVWACLNGDCLGGADIANCNQPDNPLTTVVVQCEDVLGVTQTGIDHVLGCPLQANPPSTTLGLGSSSSPTVTTQQAASLPDSGSFELVASVQVGDGTTRTLCTVTVPFQADDTPEDVLVRAQDAINNSPTCAANTVGANIPSLLDIPPGGEDEFITPPRLVLSAPDVSGGQLITALHATPGLATGVCFNVNSLGVPILKAIQVTRVQFETLPEGAMGGEITLVERSNLGACEISAPTAPGDTANDIAATLVDAFQAPGIPGPNPRCAARYNPRDVALEGDSLITVLASEIVVCLDDPGVGFSLTPEELALVAEADLAITKTDSSDPAPLDHSLTYELTVTNHGPLTATEVVLTDVLPPEVTFGLVTPDAPTCSEAGGTVTCALGALASGANASVTIMVTPTMTGTISNTATVVGQELDPAPRNSTVTETTTIEVPTAIDLLSFKAHGETGRIVLHWQTAAELDNEGFNLWRSLAMDGPYSQINPSLIPAKGNADTGASYKYVDTEVVKGVTYHYKLEDVDLNGISTFHGPVSTRPSAIWQIYLPLMGR